MKHQFLSPVLWLAPSIFLNAAPLTQRGWAALVDTATKEAGVIATASSTDSLGGVYTMTLDPRLFDPKNPNKKGDAALALYNACSSVFGKWARENGAEIRNSNWTGGSGDILFFAAHLGTGDYLSVIYQPSSAKDSQGTVTITFIDGALFARSKPNNQSNKADVVSPNGP